MELGARLSKGGYKKRSEGRTFSDHVYPSARPITQKKSTKRAWAVAKWTQATVALFAFLIAACGSAATTIPSNPTAASPATEPTSSITAPPSTEPASIPTQTAAPAVTNEPPAAQPTLPIPNLAPLPTIAAKPAVETVIGSTLAPTAAPQPSPTTSPTSAPTLTIVPTATNLPEPTVIPTPANSPTPYIQPEFGNSVGDTLPYFELTLADGATQSTAQLSSQGRPVFLFFHATW